MLGFTCHQHWGMLGGISPRARLGIHVLCRELPDARLLVPWIQVSFVKVPGGCGELAGSGRWSQEGMGGSAPAVWSTLLRIQVGDTSAPL